MPAFDPIYWSFACVYVYLRLTLVSTPRTRIFLFDPVGACMRLSGNFTAPRRERELADPGLQRTIEALEASFDAALEQSEEAAADDLAFSLLQDARLAVALSRSSGYRLHVADVGPVEVSTVGLDFVGAGDPLEVVAPSARAVAIGQPSEDASAAGGRPSMIRVPMLEVLRGWARRGHRAEVCTTEGTFRGVLTRACPDHVALAWASREVLVGITAVRYVRRVLED